MKSFNEWRKLRENSFGHDLGREASIDTGPRGPGEDESDYVGERCYEFNCQDCKKTFFDNIDGVPEGPEECPYCGSKNLEYTGNSMDEMKLRKIYYSTGDR